MSDYYYYVLGFLFNETLDKVVLIQKTKPWFLNGKYNGVGGKIENGETPEQAMAREFKEEAGVKIEDWNFLRMLHGTSYTAYCYCKTVSDEVLNKCHSMEEEQVGIFDVNNLPSPLVDHVRGLILEAIAILL